MQDVQFKQYTEWPNKKVILLFMALKKMLGRIDFDFKGDIFFTGTL